MDYRQYLKAEGYTLKTIEGKLRQGELFKKWCKRQATHPEAIDYKTCLKYIQYLQRRGNTKRTINHKLGSLKTYFKYLISEGRRSDNPLEDVSVKGVVRKVHHNLLEPDELEDLYYSFPTRNIIDPYHQLTAQRNQVMVGLLVYQGLKTSELIRLEVEDALPHKGKIYIRGSRKSNARTLELKPWQVLELQEYVGQTRESIVERRKVTSDRLFVPGNARLGNTLLHIIKKLRATNQKVVNVHQLRASVITHWLSQYNLREVQYRAGHRYISSTEKYLQDDLEGLHEMVDRFHPIGGTGDH